MKKLTSGRKTFFLIKMKIASKIRINLKEKPKTWTDMTCTSHPKEKG